jgi:dynein heavy chain
MMANRYMNTFKDEILGWNKKLMNVADVNQITIEIQRTWSYLESLFIASEEVKKELPEATVRFAAIDKEVKEVLRVFKEKKNCVECCNSDHKGENLMKFLEKQQKELEICEKALADYMESKRRAFPRFYFVSTADLLDILSNGNSPTRIMMHMSKCFQAIEKLKLDNDAPPAGTRPKALGMESCVGVEYVAFKSPLSLDGKVEQYMNLIIDKMRKELRVVLKDSVDDYPRKVSARDAPAPDPHVTFLFHALLRIATSGSLTGPVRSSWLSTRSIGVRRSRRPLWTWAGETRLLCPTTMHSRSSSSPSSLRSRVPSCQRLSARRS